VIAAVVAGLAEGLGMDATGDGAGDPDAVAVEVVTPPQLASSTVAAKSRRRTSLQRPSRSRVTAESHVRKASAKLDEGGSLDLHRVNWGQSHRKHRPPRPPLYVNSG